MGDTEFKKEHIPWNKGIPMKTESKIKLSESLKKAYSNPELRNKNIEKYLSSVNANEILDRISFWNEKYLNIRIF